jgi:hypothetical protein
MSKATINTIISDIESILSEHNITDKESFLADMSNIICQFDTDIAIKVMEDFGEEGKHQAMAIRINYGY